jgi:F-type H+-transporting ATPase subunit b
MSQIIAAFGIDGHLILIQIVNFTILMVALGYFLYNPILNMLREREEKIAQGIRDAESAAQAKSQADIEKQVVLTMAHSEAETINSRAKMSAEVTASEVITKAEETASKVMADAHVKAEQLKNSILKETEAEIAKTAVLAAEKVLRTQNS